MNFFLSDRNHANTPNVDWLAWLRDFGWYFVGFHVIPLNVCIEAYIKGVVDFMQRNPRCLKEIHLVNLDLAVTVEIQKGFTKHINGQTR